MGLSPRTRRLVAQVPICSVPTESISSHSYSSDDDPIGGPSGEAGGVGTVISFGFFSNCSIC